MSRELSPQYQPRDVEDKIYRKWEESGFFNPDKLPHAENRKPFTIVMPPPNVTGKLHAGHALFVTLQDIFIRFARMRGRKTLWLPGTDHAAIATQAKVEKLLYEKEDKSRHDLGRDEFLSRVEEFAKTSQSIILAQIRRMGASCDWSRLAYTLDGKRSLAVRTAFKKMYDLGLIYRGRRIVNWDPRMQTTVSDDEVEWKEEKTTLYYLKYGPFIIATARPETKFGDKYVVMHPDDERYKKFEHDQKIEVEWINGPITATVIKDRAIDMEFGTGVMTITPAHDATDFDIAARHGLDFEQIIDERGILLPIGGEFSSMHIKKARPLIVKTLKTKSLLEKIDENYTHRIAVNSRGGGIIEPQVKEQWFINVNAKFKIQSSKLNGISDGQEVTLKELMRHVVGSGQIKIVPERFEKIYYHWIDNLRDWCISRQIWYGHRIPVWYKRDAKFKIKSSNSTNETYEMHIGIETPEGEGWIQDSDTLDTWFSSGLWTFSTLGWPEETKDLETYHPTQIMETAYEILFFWVARMILMSTSLLGQIPFETVYLHGLVRDKAREKLSKSKGDSTDPLELIEKLGTDALRLALVFNTTPGTDSILSEEKIKGMKYFANKLWNISRFVLANANSEKYDLAKIPTGANAADGEVLEKLKETEKIVTKNLTDFAVHEAAQEIYQFVWHYFADIYVERSKVQLKDPKLKENTEQILVYCLVQTLKLLHPFMPFITEEIWGNLPIKNRGLLMIEEWPNT